MPIAGPGLPATNQQVLGPPAGSLAKKFRAWAVTFYFALAGTLYFFDSVPLALAMLQLNLLEFFIALRIKATRDALARTVQALSAAQLELALLVSTRQTCSQTREAALGLWGVLLRVLLSAVQQELGVLLNFPEHPSLTCTAAKPPPGRWPSPHL